MNKKDLHIAEPCSADWETMHGDHQTRFCDHCTKDVHNLSMMDKQEAEAFLDEKLPTGICVQYACNTDGDIMFADTQDATWQAFAQDQGVKLLLSAAAMAVPMLIAGCDTQTKTIEPTATSPITIEEGQPIKINTNAKPGASRTPPKIATPEKEIIMTKGDVAHTPKPRIEVLQGEPPMVEKTNKKDAQEKPACDGEDKHDKVTSNTHKMTTQVPTKAHQVMRGQPIRRDKPYIKKMGKVHHSLDADDDVKKQVKRLD